MILVEGMDNTGKTTLCKKLYDEFHLPGVRRSGPAPKEEMVNRVQELIMSTEMVVHDRCPVFSEPVYGSILRGGSIFGSKSWEYIWLLLWKNPLIIYCRPPIERIFDFGNREQMEGVIDQKTKLLSRYDELMNVVHIMMPNDENFLVYDWTEEGELEHLMQHVRWYLMHSDIEFRKCKAAQEYYKHLIGVKQ